MAYLVQVRREPAELQQPVLLKLASQLNVLEVVEAVDRVAKGLVVLLLDEQGVVRLVDRLDVQLNIQSIRTLHRQRLPKRRTCWTAMR